MKQDVITEPGKVVDSDCLGGKNEIRICFLGLYKESNLGDTVITQCTEKLYEQNFRKSLIVTRLYLNKAEEDAEKNWFILKINSLIYHLTPQRIYKKFHEREVKLLSTLYFKRNIRNCDAVVVNGGGLIKYTTQFFGLSLNSLLNCCKIKKVPVILNAVGVEGYEERNNKCQYLKKTLHIPSLIYISTRDDINTLRIKYFDDILQIPVRAVSDSAVWASEIYGVKKRDESNIIGLGIAWFDIFSSHGYKVTGKETALLYETIAQLLIERGYKVQLFTNGYERDNDAAHEIYSKLKRKGIDVTMEVPNNDVELIEIISKYKSIIATRLHSCIIAYSLNIPALGLVWNPKLLFWGKNINRVKWYINLEESSADYIIDMLDSAVSEGYDREKRIRYRNTLIDSIREIEQLVSEYKSS